MKRFQFQHVVRKSKMAPLLCVAALAGCEDGMPLSATGTPRTAIEAVETVEIDVAAPEAFSITDTALWDGRPTFGGVWIAYPDIEQPERVRIRNDANGKEVVGALYKRERDFPGPKIELSADAAAALGAQAGIPLELTIIALRRKTVEVEVEPEVELLDMETPLRRPSSIAPAAVVEEVEVTEPEIETPTVITPPVATPIIDTDIEETTIPTDAAAGTYLQVATLQNKSRADVELAKLITAGLDAEIREREAGGKTLYRIVVGPATSPEALEIMMSVVKELGYKDAFILG